MRWHLKAMWDAMFIPDPWVALGVNWLLALFFYYIGEWARAGMIVCLFQGPALWLYAWYLQYNLFCKYRD